MRTVASGVLLFFLLAAFQCSPGDEKEGTVQDYLLFGTKFGFCVSACNRLYYLDSEGLYQYISKTRETIAAEEFKSKGVLLSKEKFTSYKHLLSSVPSELSLIETETFGCPNCYDQGEIYIEFKNDKGLKSFRADTKIVDNPSWLQPFAAELKKAVEDLGK